MSGRYIAQHSPVAQAWFVVDVEADEVVLSGVTEGLACQVAGILEAGDAVVALVAEQRQATQALMMAAGMPGTSAAVLPSLAEVTSVVLAHVERLALAAVVEEGKAAA